MKNFFTRTLAFGIGVIATLAVLEVVLRLLPVIEGTYAADPRAQWPVHTMIPDSSYTNSSGWNLQNVQRGRVNNYGYASPEDYVRDPEGQRSEIAVFGDSYVESLMNDYRDTLPGVLGEITKREVLSFGMSGAEMPDYLGTAPLVREEFTPEWAVLLVTAGDFTRGFNAAPGYFEWDATASPPVRLVPEIHRSELAKWSRTVGLVRYLRGNLALRPAEIIKLRRGADQHMAGATAAACRDETLSNEDEALLRTYARELPRALGLAPARVILIFDADRKRIYARSSDAPCDTRASLANERLAELAAAQGMRVIDAQPLFQRHFEAGRGPLDRSPLDAHWNPAAHRLIAEEVARAIEP